MLKMRTSKVQAISKAMVNGRGHINNANKEPKQSEATSKKNELLSPNSNTENISPTRKKRRKAGKEKQQAAAATPTATEAASPQTPKTKNALNGQKLDDSFDAVSDKPINTARTSASKIETKLENNELNSSENQLMSMDEIFKTPNTSAIAAANNVDSTERQLRSSGRKKAANIFETPSRSNRTKDESVEPIEASDLDESDEKSSSASKQIRTRNLLSLKKALVTQIDKSAESENIEKENQLENSHEASEIDVSLSTEAENAVEVQEMPSPKLLDNFTDADAPAVPMPAALNTEEKLVDQADNEQTVVKAALPIATEKEAPIKVEVEVSPPIADNDHAHMQIIENVRSPSDVSVDSAKGSSIAGTDAEYPIYVVGDLFWGQIHTYCYWPCMVCPDDSNEVKRITRFINSHQMEVHVRFFADNARHSWVKRENLLRYLGLKQYKDLTNEAREKYGENSAKCKIFFPKRSQKDIWRSAVKEADQLVNVPHEERLKTFFELNDLARERLKEEKLRRKSISFTKSSLNISILPSMDSSADSSAASDAGKKRNRSESPTSPEFSPVRKSESKRRKTTSAMDRTEYLLSTKSAESSTGDGDGDADALPSTSKDAAAQQLQSQPLNNSLTPVSAAKQSNDRSSHHSPEFDSLYEMLKGYITSNTKCEPEIESGIYRAVANVWAMKQLVDERNAKNGLMTLSSLTNGGVNGNLKRLSLRLRELQQRQIVSATSSPNLTTTKSSSSMLQVTHPPPPTAEERRRSSSGKPKTRPMTEVIDDIFNLDSFYLFDNVPGRAPVCKYCLKPDGIVQRCSKGCFSWLHADCEVNVTENKEEVAAAVVTLKKRARRRKSSLKIIETTTEIIHITGDDETEIKTPTTPTEDVEKREATDEPVGEQQKGLETATSPTDTEKSALALVATTTAPPIICKECANDVKPQCFVCRSEKMIKSNQKQKHKSPTSLSPTESSKDNFVKEEIHMCNMANCGRSYHLSCLKYWPQAKPILNNQNAVISLRCPAHICHTCVSDDPKGKFQHLKDANTTKCVKCPATYHMDSTCIPAGSQILSAAHIICPRHGMLASDQNVNVSWCFICVRGGNLLCCETCPTAVHAECTNAQLEPNENYICDECESGRLPLYGEMVWAKFNAFRWWPAIILPPTEVPLNIRSKAHNPFDFVVRFFGTHDHGWISRRRVYLYVEGDWSEPPKTRKVMDQNYLRGVCEAKEAYEIVKAKTLARDTDNMNKERLHPHPYVKIKVNRAVPPVKLNQDIEMANKCGCDPNTENPCGPDSDCLNRVLYHECNPKICPAGERCQNQQFESRVSPALEIFYARKERGFGLRCREPIPSGTFIIEYVGEVINSEEFNRRMQLKSADRDENYYFLHVEKDYIIDAGPKGNMARFMNHSCDPNCETQKWSVNGLDRIGLFAIKDIPANTELTFNYHWDELLGNDKKICSCGSANCTGQIGKMSKEEIKRKQEIVEAALASRNVRRAKSVKLDKRRFGRNETKNKRRAKSANRPSSANALTTKTTAAATATENAKALRKSSKMLKQSTNEAVAESVDATTAVAENTKLAESNDKNNNNN